MRRVLKEEALGLLELERAVLRLPTDACMMCAALARPDHFIHVRNTENACVVLDRYAARRGHLLVIARRHVEDVLALGPEGYLLAQGLAFQAAQALSTAFAPTRIFIASLGSPEAVPMSFPHFHLHVIPLFETDETTRPARVFSWTEGVWVYEDAEARELAEVISSAWPV